MTPQQRATKIVEFLQRKGYEAYFVGGSVRDLLLGNEPQDFDIVTSAIPQQVAELFPRHLNVGKRFGVTMVQTDEGLFDIATFRREKSYSDRRRPDDVEWATAKQDVRRRDFTINGLLFDPSTGTVIDHVGGQIDLGLKLIRAIGDADTRIAEDPLRMLRAIRLRNQLNFQFDKALFDATQRHAQDIVHISSERIRDELNRMFDGTSRIQALVDLKETGVLEVLLPELTALVGTPQPRQYHREGDVYDHTLLAVSSLPADAPLFLVWAVLLHDIGKPTTLNYQEKGDETVITTYDHARVSAQMSKEILTRLRFSKTEIDTITWMIHHHMSLKRIEEMRPARKEAYVLDPRFPWLLELHKADASGTEPKDLSLYTHDVRLYERMKQVHQEAAQTAPALLLDGHMLQSEFNLTPGPQIGRILEQVRDAQLAGQISTQEEALKFASTLVQR